MTVRLNKSQDKRPVSLEGIEQSPEFHQGKTERNVSKFFSVER